MLGMLKELFLWRLLFSWVLRNKEGMTQDEAKKLFFAVRSKKQVPEPVVTPSAKPAPDAHPSVATSDGSEVTKQVNRLLNYMDDTNRRLDRIEENISHIRKQVDRLVKNL